MVAEPCGSAISVRSLADATPRWTMSAVRHRVTLYLLFCTPEVGAYKLLDWISVEPLEFISVWATLFPEPIRKNVQWHRWSLATYIGFARGIALMFSMVGKSQLYG